MDDLSTGYIKIFRSTKSHWLWADSKKLQWWLDILLSVNYSNQKVLIKGNLVECNRGQSVKSLETWAKEWLTTKKTVQTFFRLLQKDEMILVENLNITTRITVCKYDSYNGSVNGDDHGQETASKRMVNGRSTQTIQDNKDNKEKEANASTPWGIFSNWVNTNAPRVNKMQNPFTEDEFNRINEDYAEAFICELLLAMHNYKKLLSGNIDANLTFRNWATKRGVLPKQHLQVQKPINYPHL